MGINLNYLAISGKTPGEICVELRLRRTGNWFDQARFGRGVSGGTSHTDWYVIIDGYEEIIRGSNKVQILTKLSRGAEVLFCEISEGCMTSSAELWTNGTKLWSVRHEADFGKDHLEVEGTPPSQFAAIRDEMIAKSNESDGKSRFPCDWYFEIPSRLGTSISGFSYSKGFVRSEATRKPRGYYDDDEGQDGEFEVLELD